MGLAVDTTSTSEDDSGDVNWAMALRACCDVSAGGDDVTDVLLLWPLNADVAAGTEAIQ